MTKYVGALDQGTTSTRFMIFDHAGGVVGIHQKEHEQIYPEAGLGRARPDGDLGALAGGHRRAPWHNVGHHRRRPRCRRHHQPARDDGRLGQDDGQAGLQRDRLAGHADRRLRQRVQQGRRPGPLPGEGRPPAGDLLLGPQGPLDPRQRRGRARQGRCRPAAVRQHRHLVHLEPHRRRQRRRARHGRHQRQPHDAHEPRDPRLGRRDHGDHGHAAQHAPGDQGLLGGLRDVRRRARRRSGRG